MIIIIIISTPSGSSLGCNTEINYREGCDEWTKFWEAWKRLDPLCSLTVFFFLCEIRSEISRCRRRYVVCKKRAKQLILRLQVSKKLAGKLVTTSSPISKRFVNSLKSFEGTSNVLYHCRHFLINRRQCLWESTFMPCKEVEIEKGLMLSNERFLKYDNSYPWVHAIRCSLF